VRLIALFVIATLAYSKDSWSSGSIKVLDTDEWCSRPGIPDSPEICGPTRSDTMALFNGASGRPNGPYSQILEIGAPDAIYVIRRTSLDGGLHFPAGATAQFLVEGKHMMIKFNREESDRQGNVHLKPDHGRADILEIKKR
jgi:hypothetical protein